MVRSNVKIAALLALLLAVLLIAGAIYYAGWGRRPDPAREAANRARAREGWLDLISLKGKAAFDSSANARLLERCFKEGEPAPDCASVLATSMWQDKYPHSGTGNEFDGAVEHFWVFRVEKPPAPDATGLVFSVRV
jgi:hypothetical protein